MKKNIIIYILLIIIGIVTILYGLKVYEDNKVEKVEFVKIKSEKHLREVLETEETNGILKNILTLPVSLLSLNTYSSYGMGYDYSMSDSITMEATDGATAKSIGFAARENESSDYSETNVQVENVDEADIVKTDGKYIYSISGFDVVITETTEEGEVRIVNEVTPTNIPEDILLYKDKMIIISNFSYGSSYYSNSRTVIYIYDISNKLNVKLLNKYELDYKYYTSRMIDNKLYVLSTGSIYSNDEEDIFPSYSVDNTNIQMKPNNLCYLKNKKTNQITMIATIDVDNLTNNAIEVDGFLVPIENVYVSENAIYISYSKYGVQEEENDLNKHIKELFSFKGIIGFVKYANDYNGSLDRDYYTNILKFEFSEDGVEFVSYNSEIGKVLNQFSMDEYKNNLRVTFSDQDEGSKLVVFSNEMKKLGSIEGIAKGEKIYATRFIEDRAYMVTYKTIDPLFVIDVSNPTAPKILGELKIPGYSVYLHPYDENHIIGIGNETEEQIIRDSMGKVQWQNTYITGMKMAIFDVTDVSNPKEQFVQKIGDKYTYSSILQNHKAFLFSKEKELIAIPVNSYTSEIQISNSTDIEDVNNILNSSNYSKPIGNGYIVYNINLEEGFKEKGVISHDTTDSLGNYWYRSGIGVRGIYIDNILYTISEKFIKSHTLDTLEQKSSVEI